MQEKIRKGLMKHILAFQVNYLRALYFKSQKRRLFPPEYTLIVI
jgi:hypothetical protein